MDVTELIKIALAYIGPIVTVILYLKTAGHAKAKEHAECIDKIKLDITHHGLDQTKFQLNHEKLADAMELRFKSLESDVNQFKTVVPEVQSMKVRMESYIAKIDNLIESVKESKSDNKETMREIKDMFKAGQYQNHP